MKKYIRNELEEGFEFLKENIDTEIMLTTNAEIPSNCKLRIEIDLE
jgi:hypothetical protein